VADHQLTRASAKSSGYARRWLGCTVSWGKAQRVIDVQRKLSALLEQLATGSAEPNGGEPK
jgi:hypothetical protein